MSVECFPLFKYGFIIDSDKLEEYVEEYGDETIDEYRGSSDFLFYYCDEFYEYVSRCDHYSDNSSWVIGYDLPADRPVSMEIMLEEANNGDINPLIAKIFPRMPEDLRDELTRKTGFISTVEWC